MYQDNVIALDLAKNVIQVCILDKQNEVKTNRELRRQQVLNWLAKQTPSVVAMEACGSAHYWAKQARALGHQPVLISARFVKKFVEGHKTDKNDAVAIGIAVRQPSVKPVAIKSNDQLALQALEKMRKHYQDIAIATSNLIRAIVFEFGMVIPQGEKAFRERIPDILEDAENELPMMLRGPLHQQYQFWISLKQQVREAEKQLRAQLKTHEQCNELQKLDGVGPVNALNLYLALGTRGEAFKNGREAAACIGLTPKQHSSGGKVVMLGISQRIAKKQLRANLIQGALAKIKVVAKRPPKNTREVWMKQLIERRGLRRAAVALANKTVRIAWAMVHYQQPYQAPESVTI